MSANVMARLWGMDLVRGGWLSRYERVEEDEVVEERIGDRCGVKLK